MCVHGCRLTGKMTGAVDQVSDCASVITLNSISVITLARRVTGGRPVSPYVLILAKSMQPIFNTKALQGGQG